MEKDFILNESETETKTKTETETDIEASTSVLVSGSTESKIDISVDNNICCICLESYSNNKIDLRCQQINSHSVCKTCYIKIIQLPNMLCPLCRSKIVNIDPIIMRTIRWKNNFKKAKEWIIIILALIGLGGLLVGCIFFLKYMADNYSNDDNSGSDQNGP